MKIVKLPNGEYYLQKACSSNSFKFPVRAQGKCKTGKIYLADARVPRELVGKKLMLKVEIVK